MLKKLKSDINVEKLDASAVDRRATHVLKVHRNLETKNSEQVLTKFENKRRSGRKRSVITPQNVTAVENIVQNQRERCRKIN